MYLILDILRDQQPRPGLQDITGLLPLYITEPEFSFPFQTSLLPKSQWVWRAVYALLFCKQDKTEGAKFFTMKWGCYKIS